MATLNSKSSARRSEGNLWRWGRAGEEHWKATASEECSQGKKYLHHHHPPTPAHTHTHTHFSILTPLPIRSVKFSHSVVSDSLRPHGLQHARPPCPSPTPGVYPNSCPSSRWRHPTTSSSVVPFSSRLQSFPASRSFPMSQLLASGGQSIGVSVSTSVLWQGLFCLFRLAYLWDKRHHVKSCSLGPTGQGLKRPCLINKWRTNSTLCFGAEMPVGRCFTNVFVVLSLFLMQMRHWDFVF